MAEPIDAKLYLDVKRYADTIYEKPSAFKSGFIVKTYKQRGGRYIGDGAKPLARWFKEDWKDIGGKEYPVFRPTKRISKMTPLTPSEIDPTNLREQIRRKQIIKGERNLDPFIRK